MAEDDLEELTALLPLRVIDARVLASSRGTDDGGSSGRFTVYELEVHTTRGAVTRHRRFREFLKAHGALVAALRDGGGGASGAAQLPELSKTWNSNSQAVTTRRCKELNGWLEAAVLAVHAARTHVERPSERPHALLQVFLCHADSVSSKDGAGAAAEDDTVTIEPVRAATATAAPSADNASESGAGSSQAARSTSRSDPLAEVQLMPVLWDDDDADDDQNQGIAAAAPDGASPPSSATGSTSTSTPERGGDSGGGESIRGPPQVESLVVATAAAVGGDGSSRHLRAEALLALLGVALAIFVSTLYS